MRKRRRQRTKKRRPGAKPEEKPGEQAQPTDCSRWCTCEGRRTGNAKGDFRCSAKMCSQRAPFVARKDLAAHVLVVHGRQANEIHSSCITNMGLWRCPKCRHIGAHNDLRHRCRDVPRKGVVATQAKNRPHDKADARRRQRAWSRKEGAPSRRVGGEEGTLKSMG